MAEKNREMVQCINCKHGTFMQWFKNPIVCMCQKYQEKFVAEAKHLCDEYIPRGNPPKITHYDHYEN